MPDAAGFATAQERLLQQAEEERRERVVRHTLRSLVNGLDQTGMSYADAIMHVITALTQELERVRPADERPPDGPQ